MKAVVALLLAILFTACHVYADDSRMINEICYISDNALYLYSFKAGCEQSIYRPPLNWSIRTFARLDGTDTFAVCIQHGTSEAMTYRLLLYVYNSSKKEQVLFEKESIGFEGSYILLSCKFLSSKYLLVNEGYCESQGVQIIDLAKRKSIFEDIGLYVGQFYGFSSDSNYVYCGREHNPCESPLDGYDESEIYFYNISRKKLQRFGYGDYEGMQYNIIDSTLGAYKNDTFKTFRVPAKEYKNVYVNQNYGSYIQLCGWNPKYPVMAIYNPNGMILINSKSGMVQSVCIGGPIDRWISWLPDGNGFLVQAGDSIAVVRGDFQKKAISRVEKKKFNAIKTNSYVMYEFSQWAPDGKSFLIPIIQQNYAPKSENLELFLMNTSSPSITKVNVTIPSKVVDVYGIMHLSVNWGCESNK